MNSQFDASIVDQYSEISLEQLLAGINAERFQAAFERSLPPNLRTISHLDRVVTLASDEALPLAWVPRTDIVEQLSDVSTREECQSVLDAHIQDILDDCEAVLETTHHEWTVQCRLAIRTFQLGLEAPAQSHAANIIDSVILAAGPQRGRDAGKNRGEAKTMAKIGYNDLPFRYPAEHLALMPLHYGFDIWYPGDPIPSRFSRHATAHAVGQPGVFSRHNALVAIMLATSLTAQFWDDSTARGA